MIGPTESGLARELDRYQGNYSVNLRAASLYDDDNTNEDLLYEFWAEMDARKQKELEAA